VTVGLLVAGFASPAAAAAPTITVKPNHKLVDGQTVSVSATGFLPNTDMAIVMCPTSTISPSDCDLNTVVIASTDGNGAYSDVPYNVARTLSDGTDCVTNNGCYIGTQALDATGKTASTLVKFDPSVPPFVLNVRVDHTDKVNAKGVVTLKGTVHCENGSADVGVELDLRQVVDRSIFTSSGFAEVQCTDGSTTPFRATVRPQNGFFGPGAASVFVNAFAGSHSLYHKVGVTLTAS
jgi:hypothetical protein